MNLILLRFLIIFCVYRQMSLHNPCRFKERICRDRTSIDLFMVGLTYRYKNVTTGNNWLSNSGKSGSD